MTKTIQQILALKEQFGIQPGSKLIQSRSRIDKMPTGIEVIDQHLEGGLSIGTMSEWGVPPGRNGRRVIMTILGHNIGRDPSDTRLILWAYAEKNARVYPPAWQANGINLKTIYFTRSENPVRELKPVFMDPLFKVVVLDAPTRFTKDDMAFISTKARQNNQFVFLLRNYFLSPKRGNIWAKLRLNCWLDLVTNQYRLKIVRGMPPMLLNFKLKEPG